jgi:immunoglobulin heavy chain
MVQPEWPLRLSCVASGFTFSDYYTQWVHQASGKTLEWVGYIRNKSKSHTKEYNVSVNDRLTISIYDLKRNACLQMNRLNQEDTSIQETQ